MVPSTYEDGTLYNVLPSGNKAPDETGNHNGYDQTRADFTFSRGSNLAATRVNADGLIEKGRENLLLNSNNFNNSWNQSGTTRTSGQSGYDGTNDAWKIERDGAAGLAFIHQTISTTGVHTQSVYAKANTEDWIYLQDTGTGGGNGYFDLVNGVAGTTTGIDASIDSVGNGWYRIQVVGNRTASGNIRVFVAKANGNLTVTGSIYIQDTQFEAGLVATDYIETGSTTATAGILEDMPRINYDANGENGALLLEPSRTNLFIQSEPAFKNTHPAIVGQYLTGDNFNIGVYGGVQLNGGNTHYYYGAATSASTTYAVSFFIRRTDGGVPTMAPSSSSSNGDFMLVAYGGGFGSGDMDSYSITLFKNDVYKFEGVLTTGSSGSASNNGIIKYSANSSNDIQITGIQFEAGSYPSSYIPTHGAAVTRGADSCIKTGISNLIGQTEGVVYLEVETIHNNSDTGAEVWFMEIRKDQNNSFGISSGGADSAPAVRFVTKIAGVVSTDAEPAGFSNSKIAIKYTASEFKIFQNGTLQSTISKNIGGYVDIQFMEGAGNRLTMPLKQFIVFDEVLTDAECQTLTT